MRVSFDIADPQDDAEIRALLRDNPMPGDVTVAFEREPDYFAGHGVLGDRCITIKAVDEQRGTLAGIACVASSERFVGGEVKQVGYVGGLRIDREYRGYMIPLRAMHYIRDLVADGWPSIWLTVFAEENRDALRIFVEKPRPSFPPLDLVSRIHTLGISTRRRKSRRHTGISVADGARVGMTRILRFLRQEGRRREFFPVCREEHFAADRARGFTVEDFLVGLQNGEIVGVGGVWDQSSFKQSVVHGYSGYLRAARPVMNLVAPALRTWRLPAVGERISAAYFSFSVVRDDDAAVFDALLDRAVAAAFAKGKHYLLAGFSVRDPLLGAARKRSHILYRSSMHAFTFAGSLGAGAFDRSRVPYLEIAAL